MRKVVFILFFELFFTPTLRAWDEIHHHESCRIVLKSLWSGAFDAARLRIEKWQSYYNKQRELTEAQSRWASRLSDTDHFFSSSLDPGVDLLRLERLVLDAKPQPGIWLDDIGIPRESGADHRTQLNQLIGYSNKMALGKSERPEQVFAFAETWSGANNQNLFTIKIGTSSNGAQNVTVEPGGPSASSFILVERFLHEVARSLKYQVGSSFRSETEPHFDVPFSEIIYPVLDRMSTPDLAKLATSDYDIYLKPYFQKNLRIKLFGPALRFYFQSRLHIEMFKTNQMAIHDIELFKALRDRDVITGSFFWLLMAKANISNVEILGDQALGAEELNRQAAKMLREAFGGHDRTFKVAVEDYLALNKQKILSKLGITDPKYSRPGSSRVNRVLADRLRQMNESQIQGAQLQSVSGEILAADREYKIVNHILGTSYSLLEMDPQKDSIDDLSEILKSPFFSDVALDLVGRTMAHSMEESSSRTPFEDKVPLINLVLYSIRQNPELTKNPKMQNIIEQNSEVKTALMQTAFTNHFKNF